MYKDRFDPLMVNCGRSRSDSTATVIIRETDINSRNLFNMSQYIKWDAPGVEIIEPGEDELKTKTAQHFCAMQALNFQQTHHCMRATHLKTQGVSLKPILQ